MAPENHPGGLPELATLTESYEIEAELHRGATVTAYVARQKESGRRVTVTVLDAATPAQRTALTHLAADARLLTNARHPHVVPVLETRWLAANRLAIVRVHVRGTTLRQAIDSVGPMPEARTTEILADVGEVLEWAARTGITHRHVKSDSICFQKGSGKVMVSFGLPAIYEGTHPPADDGTLLPERCADGMTLGRLGYEMLTAHHASDASTENLRAVRPDLSPRTTEAIDAGLQCVARGTALDSRKFLWILTGDAPAIGAGVIATAASAPVVPRAATSPLPPPQLPLGGPTVGNPAPERPVVRDAEPGGPSVARHEPGTEYIVLPPPADPNPAPVPTGYAPPADTGPVGPPGGARRRGRGLLVASLLALVALIGSTFYLIARDRAPDEARVAASGDTAAEESGDVAVEEETTLPPDPGGLTTESGTPPAGVPPVTTPLPPAEQPAPSPVEAEPEAEPRAEPPAEAPRPVANVCASPAPQDQRACFNRRLSARDAELNSVYQALMREVRERQGSRAAETLRAQQRAWIADRDRRCEGVGSDDFLWAEERVECLGRISDARAFSLARELARLRSAP